MTGFKAQHNLAIVYQEMGNLEAAERHFELALQLAPGFEPSAIGLNEIRRLRSQPVGAR